MSKGSMNSYAESLHHVTHIHQPFNLNKWGIPWCTLKLNNPKTKIKNCLKNKVTYEVKGIYVRRWY